MLNKSPKVNMETNSLIVKNIGTRAITFGYRNKELVIGNDKNYPADVNELITYLCTTDPESLETYAELYPDHIEEAEDGVEVKEEFEQHYNEWVEEGELDTADEYLSWFGEENKPVYDWLIRAIEHGEPVTEAEVMWEQVKKEFVDIKNEKYDGCDFDNDLWVMERIGRLETEPEQFSAEVEAMDYMIVNRKVVNRSTDKWVVIALMAEGLSWYGFKEPEREIYSVQVFEVVTSRHDGEQTGEGVTCDSIEEVKKEVQELIG